MNYQKFLKSKTDRYGGNRRERRVMIDGYYFDSHAEGQLYLYLKEGVKKDEYLTVKPQDTVYLTKARFLMKPDFRVTLPDNSFEWHEMKGNIESEQWKRNTRLWKAGYGPFPGAKLTVWKMNRRGVYIYKVIICPLGAIDNL